MIKRFDVWLVSLNPTQGKEINKNASEQFRCRASGAGGETRSADDCIYSNMLVLCSIYQTVRCQE